ncbi:NAD(P)/FAD-dependent oxidoreductase [Pseudarthrobacter sp. NPDC058329]|uniref:NAD(P)/FAD-dependent oxidoreductase n=1 Tax=Pseudarthrobacter sp. NPDC058329 TaxID=3346448 RepID=UPI0036D96CBB
MNKHSKNGMLVIGGCQAAVQFAVSLRDLGYAEPITMVSDEHHLPYQRPPLSKGYLSGDVTEDALIYRSAEFYVEHNIDVRLGERIVRIERNEAGGGEAVSQTGDSFAFDRVALAVGAAPRRLALDGADASGVLYLRDAHDAAELRDRLGAAERVVIIGGGFIGLEAAESARTLGKHVTVIEVAPRLIGRAVGLETSAFFLKATRRRGIEVLLSAQLDRIAVREDGRVSGVVLRDGTVLGADIVVIGVGVVPRVELALELGLAVDNGIVVDEFSVASDGSTIAVGDCANLPNPYPKDPLLPRIRLESVNNAMEQSISAAKTVMGFGEPYHTVPWFWSDQADLKLQIAGLSSGYDTVITRGDPEEEKVSFFYFAQGELIAADCVNSPAEFAITRNALRSGRKLDQADAARTDVPFKTLIREAQPL